MDIYEKLMPLKYWEYKKYYSFYIPEGGKKKLLEILKECDKDEFEYYFPEDFKGICETLKQENGNLWIKEYCRNEDYVGKFDLNLEKFYAICDRESFPVYIEKKEEIY